MAVEELALPAGLALNEYRIESTLGVGGFGLTYLATDVNLNLRVAIKEYLPGDLALRGGDLSVSPKSTEAVDTFKWGLDRFLDESRTLATFRHPNIVRVMRYFLANATAYMVMEFVEGQSLSDWAKARRPLPELALRGILIPLLDGLGVVHQRGFLHRDIKPGNIFIREDGTPVLLDFGSARMTSQKTELTAIVTPGYAPLEQYHSHGKQGPWSDIYALGGVLYWLVTGTRPVEAAARVRNDPLPPAIQAGDHSRYSPDLLTTIDWMLTPDESQRPQLVGEVIAALNVGEAGADKTVTLDLSDAPTQVAVPPKAPARAQPLQPTSAPATSLPTAMALDRDTVKKIESELLKHIGPIASIMVRKAAVAAPDIATLARTVAGEIEDDKARQAFLRRYAEGSDRSVPASKPSGLPTSQATTIATALAAQRFETPVLDRAEKALAQHLGPLARVVVKRAAMRARDVSELYLLLADEIEDKDERKAFVRKAISNRD